ncbi:MAG TPA: hypothetical protein DCQ51_16580 [Planktothrix sp. UBA8407]|jgi:hypothetical protein|nr:hypothetical protein [Planktothrix sp. UBA8407]HBK24971.1 hypothetical protein [Planktothrix sp. UBA10369]
MLKNASLQARLITAFLFIGLIVFIVALVGWSTNHRLSSSINTLTTNSLPSVIGLWKINEGQTQIESSERALLNINLNQSQRNTEITRIKKAWEQIDRGFKQYDATEKNSEEKAIYSELLPKWDEWKQGQERFMQLNQEFSQLGVFNPIGAELELLRQGRTDTPELLTIKRANNAFNQMSQQAEENRPRFEAATELLLKDIELNEGIAIATEEAANKDIANSTFWLIIALILGPLTAIIFGGLF